MHLPSGLARGVGTCLFGLSVVLGVVACKSQGNDSNDVVISDEAVADVRQIDAVLRAFDDDVTNGSPTIDLVANELASRLTNDDLLILVDGVADLREAELEDRDWVPDPALEAVLARLADLPYFRDLPSGDSARARASLWGIGLSAEPVCGESCRHQLRVRLAQELGTQMILELIGVLGDAVSVAECFTAVQRAGSCLSRDSCVGDLANVATTCLWASSQLFPWSKVIVVALKLKSIIELWRTLSLEAPAWEQTCREFQAMSCADAGVDAVLADASGMDGGAADAMSADAVPPDGGTTDGGASDAPPGDAATSDAAMSDAAMSDAAMTDAAMTDAAMTDADMTDADMTDADMTDAEPDAPTDAEDVDAEIDASN